MANGSCENCTSCAQSNSQRAKELLETVRASQRREEKTVEQWFDESIQQARKQVEDLCIKKAKLEALNLHNHPYTELRQLLEAYVI